jgi:hypothetical protein
MSEVKVKIVLTRAPDDPKVNERSFQEELGEFWRRPPFRRG